MVLQTGGLGDLVLAGELINGVKKAQPTAHVTLICKAAIAGIAELYPIPPDDVMALEFNPYAWDAPSPELLATVRPIVEGLAARGAEVFIDATFQPSWFGWVAAAAIEAERACCCTAIPKPEFFVATVLEGLQLGSGQLENLGLPAETHEVARYRLFIKLLGLEPQRVFPWAMPPHVAQRGGDLLSNLGYCKGEYLACFP